MGLSWKNNRFAGINNQENAMSAITNDPAHNSLALEMSVDTYTAVDAFLISESDDPSLVVTAWLVLAT